MYHVRIDGGCTGERAFPRDEWADAREAFDVLVAAIRSNDTDDTRVRLMSPSGFVWMEYNSYPVNID